MEILKYSQFNETLKSDDIEIVTKKLANLFKSYGLTEREFGHVADTKNTFLITSDRRYIKIAIEEYKSGRYDKQLKSRRDNPSRCTKQDMIDFHQSELDEHKKGDIFIWIDSDTYEIGPKLIHSIDTIGYFISVAGNGLEKIKDKSKINDYILNNKKLFIIIEPNFDDKVNFRDEYLYHTTDVKNLDKILSRGLIPKSKNTRSFYPERVYLAPSIEYLDSIKYQLNIDKKAEYVSLRIKNFDGLSLYKDVRFKGGFYTYDNIPPKYIEVMK